ncbi:hypothetical protein DL96DRAFT_1639895 [Flagelloscypha sp. PMI_526]|nr:hypothetical protein DL96DRAFT_1639895 [Flagelloscypha sp. PMI_526]
MPHLTLPAEILDMVWTGSQISESSQTLKQLTLTARRLVPHVQAILFEILLSATPMGGQVVLKLLKTRPNLTLLVKRLTLTRHAMQHKVTVQRNMEITKATPGRTTFLAAGWPWNDLDPSVAASLATVGQHLPRLKRIVYRDLEGLPINTILEHAPQLTDLELSWTQSSTSLFRHHPSCQLLICLQSLTLEFHHMGSSYSRNQPLDHFALILKDLQYISREEKKPYWDAIDTTIAKLGVATTKRPRWYGLLYHPDDVKTTLAVVDVATSVEVEIDETWRGKRPKSMACWTKGEPNMHPYYTLKMQEDTVVVTKSKLLEIKRTLSQSGLSRDLENHPIF